MACLKVAEPPHGPWGWFNHPRTADLGVAEPPLWPMEVVQPPPLDQREREREREREKCRI
jgi:hypothetical protein